MIDQLVQYDDNGSTLPPSKTTVRKRSKPLQEEMVS
jgi:hypothetical protein